MMPADVLLSHPEQVRRIAILRALYLGDLLVAVPAFRALRRRFRHAEITLIGLPWARSFARRFRRYIDRFVEFAGYPGIPEVPVEPERSRRFLEEQRRYGYDLVVQMHGDGRVSNPCVLAFGARATVGFCRDERPEGLMLALPVEDRSIVKQCLDLVALSGCDAGDSQLEFPLYAGDYAEAAALLRALPSGEHGEPRIGLHAGARPSSRRWPARYFAEVGDELARRYGAQVVLTAGPGEETTTQIVAEHMHTSALNLAGKTSIGGLGALISQLDLFISNDTGPAHLAQAVGCPTIILFGPASYRRWAPLDQTRYIALRNPVPCSPCDYWDCPIDHPCLRGLHPSVVLEHAEKILESKKHMRKLYIQLYDDGGKKHATT